MAGLASGINPDTRYQRFRNGILSFLSLGFFAAGGGGGGKSALPQPSESRLTRSSASLAAASSSACESLRWKFTSRNTLVAPSTVPVVSTAPERVSTE